MTLVLPDLFHWSPASNRSSIARRGLRPSCPTAVWVRPDRPGELVGHDVRDLVEDSILTVCLGTSPSTSWALSGAHSAERGEVWDLYEVELDADDEVHFRPIWGDRLDEVRVATRIPKSRCWLVASRVVPMRGRR